MIPSSTTQCRLYGELAHLWPLVSPVSEYAQESNNWRSALRAELGPGRHDILELGAGGGHLLYYLKDDFEVFAVDSSEEMLRNSRKLNPEVLHHVGDMKQVRLGENFALS